MGWWLEPWESRLWRLVKLRGEVMVIGVEVPGRQGADPHMVVDGDSGRQGRGCLVGFLPCVLCRAAMMGPGTS